LASPNGSSQWRRDGDAASHQAMNPSALAGHILELVAILQADPRPADRIIDLFFRSRRYLGSHDRREIAESVYGILRHRRFLQILIAALHETAVSSPAWLYAAYKLHIEKANAQELRARALELTAQEISALAGLEVERLTPTLGERLSFPDWLVVKLQAQMGEPACAQLLAALNAPAPLMLRVNTLKTTRENCMQELHKRGFPCHPARFSPTGLQLAKRSNLFGLDLFRAGWFELQDEGSQIISLLLDPRPNWRIADVCAGGGGKTLHLAALMKNRGEIIASDVSQARLENLHKRLRRNGVHNVRSSDLSSTQKRSELAQQLDGVLIDVPCSGTGVLRRNPDAKWKISPHTVLEMSNKQIEILRDYAALVKPGGRLVYATCSLLVEENEAVVQAFLHEHPEFHAGDAATILQRYGLAALATGNSIRLYPHEHGCDGFFAAVLQRS